jgi:iron complex outermembrane receptor protein
MKKLSLILLCSICALWAVAQSNTVIRGKITSADGQPVPFVTISLLNTKMAMSAGEDGRFELLNIKPGKYTLQVSATGLQSQSKELNAELGKISEVNFELKESARQLEGVVVNARRSLNVKAVSVGKAGHCPNGYAAGYYHR